MWNSKKIASAILLLAFVALAPGCVYDKAECPDVPPGKADAYLRLQLRLEVNSATRSNPTGGEDGDGREDGQDNECAINRLDLVIYNSGKENAINTDGDAVVKRHLVFFKEELNNFFKDDNGDNKNGYYLVPLHNYSFAENDRILAYANAPGLDIEPGNKISELKDLCPYQTWTGKNAKEANNFTMATARWNYKSSDNLIDGKIYSEIGDRKFSGGENDPFYARCTIERTAARIDFMFNKSDKQADKIIYSVTSPSLNEATAEVWITNILPVNLMQKPSYFFKHVTNSFKDTTVNVCQGETLDPKGLPANYVMEPTTLAKTKKGADIPSLSDLFGATAKSDKGEAFGDSNAIGSLFANELIKDCDDDSRFDKYCILAYTNENTWTGTDFNADFMTGLAFKAIYYPKTVYKTASAAELTGEDKDLDYQPRNTFYRFSPTRIPDGKDWDSGFDVYFSNWEAAVRYDGLHPELNGIITEYEDAVCYYNLWLRHANYEEGSIPDPAEAIPMEYVIVRNNIYRVGVTFSGPGNPDPGLREPHNIKSRIFVRKWNVRRHSTIIM